MWESYAKVRRREWLQIMLRLALLNRLCSHEVTPLYCRWKRQNPLHPLPLFPVEATHWVTRFSGEMALIKAPIFLSSSPKATNKEGHQQQRGKMAYESADTWACMSMCCLHWPPFAFLWKQPGECWAAG